MTFSDLNTLPLEALKEELTKCCGSSSWVNKMSALHPFTSEDQLFNMAERLWHECNEEDWKEAFTHHPKLGDIESLKEKYANTKDWAKDEQAAAKESSPEVLEELAYNNKVYEEKFGFIYILYATGKTAKVILSILRIRLNNDLATELIMSMVEQNKITKLRLEKMLS